jgi:hypothetical protein
MNQRRSILYRQFIYTQGMSSGISDTRLLIQDLRSILNRSIESLEKGNITEAINNLRIADDQLRILED